MVAEDYHSFKTYEHTSHDIQKWDPEIITAFRV